MLHKEQVKELCRKYLEDEISAPQFYQELMRVMYTAQSTELIQWMSEQLLIAR